MAAATDRSLRAAAAAATAAAGGAHSRTPMRTSAASYGAQPQAQAQAPLDDDGAGGVDLDAPMDAPLSADYLSRRHQRMHPQHSPAGMSLSNGHAYGAAQQGGGGGGDWSSGGDGDYRLEALQLTVSAFKTKMRADFDSTFSTLERKSRTQRKELLAHVTASLEEAESRLAAALKTNLNDYQLLEIEFRKNLKMDLYQLRSDMESEMRHQEEVRTEMQRKMKMQESVALELRQKLEELLIGRGGAGGPLSPSGSLAWDQQLLSFQHSLEALQTKFSLELLGSKKESEMKLIDVGHQILDLRRVVESGLQQDEANQRAQADLLREHAERAAADCQTKVDESLAHMNTLLKNLYRNLELQSQNQDVLHGQLSELQAADNAAAPPSKRRVTQAQLDALEDKLLGALGLGRDGGAAAAGAVGGVPSAAVRELTNSVEIQSRKLEQLSTHARELAAESDLQTRMALEKFRKEFALATEARIGNLALDSEITKRKLELLNPESLANDLQTRVAQVEKDAAAKLALVREEHERALRSLQVEGSAAREKQNALERRNEDLAGSMAALEAKLGALSSSFDTRLSAMAADAASREKKHLTDLFELREKNASDLHALRKELEESGSVRERRLMDELGQAHSRLMSSTEEKHGQLSSRLEAVSGDHAKGVSQLERAIETDVNASVRRLDAEIKRVAQAVLDVEAQTRRNEDTMKLAEEMTRTTAAAAAAAALPEGSMPVPQAEWSSLNNTVSSLSLQQKLLVDRHELLSKTLTDAIKEQSALQSSVHSFQRDVERSLHTAKQAELESLQASQHAAARTRAELEGGLAEVEARVRQEYNELKLKLQDVEHTVKLGKKYASGDALISPRQQGASADSIGGSSGSGSSSARADAAAVASGGALVKESAFRLFQQQFEEFEFKFFNLAQQCANLKVQHEDVSARTEALEAAVREGKKAGMAREAAVDEALRHRLEVAAFDKFKRDLHATSQSQHHAVLSTAQAALAAANQAKHSATDSDGFAHSSSPSALNSSSLSFTSPLALRSQPQAVSEMGRAAAPAPSSSTPSIGSVSPKGVLRRPSQDAGSHRSVRFADGDQDDSDSDSESAKSKSSSSIGGRHIGAAAAVASQERSESGALLSLPHVYSPNVSGSLPALQASLERGHTMLKHFALGPPVRKHVFYSPRALPHAATGALPVIPPSVAAAGFVYWVEPGSQTSGVLPMATLPLAEVQAVYVGAHTKAFLKSSVAGAAGASALDPRLCLSIWSDEHSLEVQAESTAVRSEWVRGLCLLLNKHRVPFKLIGELDVGDSDDDDEQPQTQPQPQQPQQGDDDSDVSSTGSVQRGDDDGDMSGSSIAAAVAAATAATHSKPLDHAHSPVHSDDDGEDNDIDLHARDLESADDSFDVVRASRTAPASRLSAGGSSPAPAPTSPLSHSLSSLSSSLSRSGALRDSDARLNMSADSSEERRLRQLKQREADEQLAKVQAQRRAEEEQMHAERVRREEEESARQARLAAEARDAARRAQEEEAARTERLAAQAAEMERARLARVAAAEAAERERLAEEQAAAAATARKAEAEAIRLQAEQEAEAQRARLAAALHEEELRAEAERSARGKQSRIAEEAAEEHQRKLESEEQDRAVAAAAAATAAAASLAELEQRQRAKQDAPMSRLEAVRAAALKKQQDARRKKEEEEEEEKNKEQQREQERQQEREAQAEQQRAEQDRAEKDRVEAEAAEAHRAAEADRVRLAEADRVEAERERAEAERVEAERLETERVAVAQRAAADREEKERAEAERIEQEQAQAAARAAERAEAERVEAERATAERDEALRRENEEAQRIENERIESERIESQRAAQRATAEREQREQQQSAQERADQQQLAAREEEEEALNAAAAAAASSVAAVTAPTAPVESDELAESEEEEGEDDEEDEDDRPEWLQPTDHIVQLTLRAQSVTNTANAVGGWGEEDETEADGTLLSAAER